jgi:hypothetical protein
VSQAEKKEELVYASPRSFVRNELNGNLPNTVCHLNFESSQIIENASLHFAMCRVYIRLVELVLDLDPVPKLTFVAEMMSSRKAVLQKVKAKGIRFCKNSWKFKCPCLEDEFIDLTLKDRMYKKSDKALGRCRLPLEWFPQDRVVREWFPMNTETDQGPGPSIIMLIDVQVAVKTKNFRASSANLRVIPGWERPQALETQFPLPPQLVFAGGVDMIESPYSSTTGNGQTSSFWKRNCPSVKMTPLSETESQGGTNEFLQQMELTP